MHGTKLRVELCTDYISLWSSYECATSYMLQTKDKQLTALKQAFARRFKALEQELAEARAEEHYALSTAPSPDAHVLQAKSYKTRLLILRARFSSRALIRHLTGSERSKLVAAVDSLREGAKLHLDRPFLPFCLSELLQNVCIISQYFGLLLII